MANLTFDVAIVGASFGGVAAALAAARSSTLSIALIDSGDWVGGQATSQGLTRWDENTLTSWPNEFSASASYRALKTAVGDWYRRNSSLAPGADVRFFNPGAFEPGQPFAADPAVVQRVMRSMLAQYGHVRLMLGTEVTGVRTGGGEITGLSVRGPDGTGEVSAGVYLDATDLGDLLPKSGAAWFIGAESQADTGESDAERAENRTHIQPITVPIALERRPDGETDRIAMPAGYPDAFKGQEFGIVSHRNGDIGGMFTHGKDQEPLWTYRRYIDARNFADPEYACDRSTMNVGSNDYQGGTIPSDDAVADAKVVDAARLVSTAYAYYLQNDAPRDGGGGTGYPNLKLRPDAFGRDDATAPQPYIRESRRIWKPLVRIVEEDIVNVSGRVRAPKNFTDSVGIGSYGIDVHPIYPFPPNTPWKSVDTLPFQLPLGSLVPSDVANLVAACKNIGATHLTSGAYRVHPGEWAVGEAAGTLAAYCVGQRVRPADVWNHPARLAALQLRLLEQGVPIFWWSGVALDDPQVFAAAHLVGVRGLLVDDATMDFQPNGSVDRDAVDRQAGKKLPWPSTPMTRAQTAVWLCAELGLPSNDIVKGWNVPPAHGDSAAPNEA